MKFKSGNFNNNENNENEKIKYPRTCTGIVYYTINELLDKKYTYEIEFSFFNHIYYYSRRDGCNNNRYELVKINGSWLINKDNSTMMMEFLDDDNEIKGNKLIELRNKIIKNVKEYIKIACEKSSYKSYYFQSNNKFDFISYLTEDFKLLKIYDDEEKKHIINSMISNPYS